MSRLPVHFLAFLLLVCPSRLVAADQARPAATSVEQIAASARKSLVVIVFAGRDGKVQGLGTGFVVGADGLIATNLHVLGEGRPITVQLADGKRYDVTSVLRRQEELPLLLISSDMNHFATDAETRLLDDMALTALQKLDPAGVYETVTANHISMCGVLPAVIVLETLRQLGTLRQAQRVAYATSADVTGDPSRVVGYAGMLFG